MRLELELDDDPLTPVSAYRVPPERVARYAAVAPTLTPANAVAVTCTLQGGDTVETIVNIDTMEHCVFEDPIMFTAVSLASLVEAQFEEDGPWVLSRGTREGVESERKVNFIQRYEKDVTSKLGSFCMATLRKMLQKGPVTRLFTGGGGKHMASHEGFALRMPPEEVEHWQTLDDKGVVQDVPRPAHAVRVWNAEGRCYDDIDATLEGAPGTPEEADKWFVETIKKLKGTHPQGSELLNRLVMSTRTLDATAVEECRFEVAFEGEFQSRWTDLIVQTEPAEPPSEPA